MLSLQEYWNKRDSYAGEPLYWWVEELMMKLMPKSVIEIGCGAGVWGKYFKNYKGYDFAEERIKGLSNCFFGDIVKGIDDKADLIFINMVLLHIREKDIIKAINNLKKMAKKNIILIEPITFRNKKAEHCFYHNYMQIFPELVLWRTIPNTEEDIGIMYYTAPLDTQTL